MHKNQVWIDWTMKDTTNLGTCLQKGWRSIQELAKFKQQQNPGLSDQEALKKARYHVLYQGQPQHMYIICDTADNTLMGFINECTKHNFPTTVHAAQHEYRHTYEGNTKDTFKETRELYLAINENKWEKQKQTRKAKKEASLEIERKADYIRTKELLATADYKLMWKGRPVTANDLQSNEELIINLKAYVRKYAKALGISIKLDSELDEATSTFNLKDWVDSKPSIGRRDWYSDMRSSENDESTTIWDYPARIEAAQLSQGITNKRRRNECSMYDLATAALQVKWFLSNGIENWIDDEYTIDNSVFKKEPVKKNPEVEYTGQWEVETDEFKGATIDQLFTELEAVRKYKSNIKTTKWKNVTLG